MARLFSTFLSAGVVLRFSDGVASVRGMTTLSRRQLSARLPMAVPPHRGAFVLPRGRLEEDPAHHSASAISLHARMPTPRAEVSEERAQQDASGSKVEAKVFGASSKIGNRKLKQDDDPWAFNAWDDIQWGEDQEAEAQAAIARQIASPVPEDARDKYNDAPADFWDDFYRAKKDSFFKDRAWLKNEFEPLAAAVAPSHGPVRIAELGCGPGNTLFPVLAMNENPDLFIYGLDYSSTAVDLVRANPAYDPQHCFSTVWDLSSPLGPPKEIESGSLDLIITIFVFSALHPDEWRQAVHNLHTMLKPGGRILFRDYGRNDLTQLRMKGGRLLQENLYIRGDGTRVYFFERDELERIFCGSTQPTIAPASSTENGATTDSADVEGGPFELIKLGIDRRLLLNRLRRLKMYRIWLQGEFRRPLDAAGPTSVTPQPE